MEEGIVLQKGPLPSFFDNNKLAEMDSGPKA